MNARSLAPLTALAIVGLVARRDLSVRAIRAMDRRGGLATRCGERAYAGAAGIFAGLHRRVAADVVAIVGDRAASVLDIGPGPGDVLRELASLVPAAILNGVEPSAEMRGIAAARGVVEVDGRAEDLPVPDHSIDLVISALSMHHWDDPGRGFAEIRRVLRPQGEARLYDIRFAAYSEAEVRGFAHTAGIEVDAVRRSVLDERVVGMRPYVVITIGA